MVNRCATQGTAAKLLNGNAGNFADVLIFRSKSITELHTRDTIHRYIIGKRHVKA